jgi:hypothetical protein
MKQAPKTPATIRPIRTPPRSAPTQGGRYSTSRLEQLAAPRPSSAWKKPIKSKFQQRHTQFTCSSAWDEVVLTNKRLSKDQQKIDSDLRSLHARLECKSQAWQNEVSPKIKKMVSNIKVSSADELNQENTEEDNVVLIAQMSKIGYFKDEHDNAQNDWNDCYSTTDDSNVNSPRSRESQDEREDERVLSLEKRINELSQLIVDRDLTIAELLDANMKKESSIEEEVHPVLNSQTVATTTHSIHTSDATKANDRLSLDSIGSRQGSFNDLFRQLSRELDTKLSEIDRMRLDHEARVEIIHDTSTCSFESELFHDENRSKTTSPDACSCRDPGISIAVQIETLTASLEMLKQEHQSLKESFHSGNDEFYEAFTQNCNKIMNYVREEMNSECLPVKELHSYNEALQYELEVIRWENSELKAELQKMKDERDATVLSTPHKKSGPVLILSPLPTLESWDKFCNRLKEALAGNKHETNHRKKIVLDCNATKQAGYLFQELAFELSRTPFRQPNKTHDEDIFIDAIS